HEVTCNHRHGSNHPRAPKGVSEARLLWSVLLNQLLTVAQAAAGVISGSVALLSDAAHNFNDANALLITYVARRISRKPANRRYTFGYRRAEMIGAVINLTLLGAIGLYLAYEAVMRFIQPVEIIGWLMAAGSILALVVDVATVLLLWSMSSGSLNVRAAFVHNLVDALGSVAVLVGAAAIIWLDWTWTDPALTLM
ncbi:MAG: cation transporter, partial [Planctomycetaceae bacterium]|nr:cation transporter [Planctomycetaceae bacterium]